MAKTTIKKSQEDKESDFFSQTSTHVRHENCLFAGAGSPGRARTADLMINNHFFINFN